MATFTMQLKDVIEHVYGTSMDPDDWEQPYGSFTFNGVTYGKLPTLPDPILLGLGTYPIFNEEYRPILNGKIIDEYYNQEINTETIDNWLLTIRRKMDQIMPYYNKLYLTELIPYSALDTMKIHTVTTAKSDELSNAESTGVSSSDSDAKSRAVQSNTPQTMLSGNEDYATAASDSISTSATKGDTEQSSTANTSNEANSDHLVTGYQAAASDLINKYRATLLNIDTSVILEVQDCFMALLNNGDAYTSQSYYAGWTYSS